MFEDVTNNGLKATFQKLKSYIDRWVIVFVFLLLLLILTLVLGATFLIENTYVPVVGYDAEISKINEAIEDLKSEETSQESAKPSEEVQVPDPTRIVAESGTEDQLTVTVAVQIGYNAYNAMWEYLEYGNTVEYFQPEGTAVSFYFDYGDTYYYSKMDLEPPQFRAFTAKFPEYITYYEEGYQVNATIQGEEVISINWVENSAGQRVWDPSMERTPRELNALEKWSLMYAEAKGYEFLVEDWFDTLPACRERNDWGGSICRYIKWSPAEENARAQAFYNFATNPENNVWVQIWGAVDVRYRWVDAETGEPLDVVDSDADLWELPESGRLALQIAIIGDGTRAEPESWETTYTIKVSPGFVVGVDQMGYIFDTGPVGWIMSNESQALRTREWPSDKLINLLPAEIAEE